MRIECENCRAVYTIADGLVSNQPIGAQCPYCGHVQMVRADGGGGGPPSSPPYGEPPGLQALPASAAAGIDPMAGAAAAFGGFGDLGRPPAGADFDMGGATQIDAGPGARCQVCGVELTDEFDKVIGLCETHQRERSAQSTDFGAGAGGADAGPAAGDRDAGDFKVRLPTGEELGPYSLADLRREIRSGAVDSDASVSKNGQEFRPLGDFAELRSAAKSPLNEPVGLTDTSAKPRMRPPKNTSSVSPGVVVLGLLLLAVAAGGYYVLQAPEQIQRYYNALTKPKRGLPKGTNPLVRQLAKWRSVHSSVTGTPEEHLIAARARHLEDTWSGYQLAEESIQRALLLDEDHPGAIGAYVENLVLWKGELIDADEERLAKAALRYAEGITAREPAVFRAQAALSLLSGDLNACRDYAERALAENPSDGQARLLSASSFLAGNSALAAQYASSARDALPQLRRADRLLAEAYANQGRYAAALKLLEARVKVDPKGVSALILLGSLERELARFDRAEDAYRRAIAGTGDTAKARLSLGELLIETRNLQTAIANFKTVAEDSHMPATYRARALAGWAKAELLRRRYKQADDLAGEALKLAPRDAVALLVRSEAALETGSATTATSLAERALQVRGDEPAALIIRGRAWLKRGKLKTAEADFEQALQNDPKDPRLAGILAGMYLFHGGTTQAFTVMRRVAEIDPEERDARHRKGMIEVSERAVLEAIERFRESAKVERNRSVAHSSIGVLFYQMGDNAQALVSIDRALKFDESNLTALVYLAQIALEQGQLDRANAAAEKVLRIDRGSALGLLLKSRVEQRRGRLKEARAGYEAALRASPGLLTAEVELAGMDLESGGQAQAIEALATALRVYPHMLKTRRLLLKADY